MGVGEWFGRAWYDVKDFFSISEVEASKDEYEMLIQSLKNAIKQIDEWGLQSGNWGIDISWCQGTKM